MPTPPAPPALLPPFALFEPAEFPLPPAPAPSLEEQASERLTHAAQRSAKPRGDSDMMPVVEVPLARETGHQNEHHGRLVAQRQVYGGIGVASVPGPVHVEPSTKPLQVPLARFTLAPCNSTSPISDPPDTD